ncbi:MAG: WG repeat-containing protein [Clostridia bacterium]|nr:WG repeat-containing protein [Clostridia bacterium]
MKVNKIVCRACLLIALSLFLLIPTYATATSNGYEVTHYEQADSISLEYASEGLISFYNDSWKYGYMNTSGKVVIDPIYDSADDFHSGVARVSKEDETLFIDMTGKVLFKESDISDQFDDYVDVYSFSEGLALVEVGYYDVGYINIKGEFVIPVGKYTSGGSFSEGIAYVSDDDGDYAIDQEGKVVFELNYDWEYYDFKHDRAVVYDYDSEQYGYVDKKGNVVIPFKLDDAFDFSGDYAVYSEVGKYGIIDKMGNFVMAPVYDNLGITGSGFVLGYDGLYTTLLNKDLVPIRRICGDLIGGGDGHNDPYNSILIDQNSTYVYVRDYAGNILGKYNYVASLGEDIFATDSGDIINTSNMKADIPGNADMPLIGDYVFDFIGEDGQVALSLPEYDWVAPFSEGLAIVEKNGKYGYINTSGEVVIPIKYDDADNFVDGAAEVYAFSSYYSIDKEGKKIPGSSYDDYYGYDSDSEDEAAYYTITVDDYGPMGLIERATNKVVLEPVYDYINYLGHDLYELSDDNYDYGFYNAKTASLIEPQYEDYNVDFDRNIIVVYNDDYTCGVITTEGKTILDAVYDDITVDGRKLMVTEKGATMGLVTLNGKVVLEDQYEGISYYETVGDLDIYAMVTGDREYYMTYDTVKDKMNKIVEIDFGGDSFNVLEQGYIVYLDSTGKRIFKDLDGNTVLSVTDEIVDYSGDYLQLYGMDGHYYLMDFKGNTYLKGNDFNDLYLPVENNHIIFSQDGGYGIVSLNGEIETKKLYNNVNYITSDVMLYYEDGQYGYVTIQGDEIKTVEQYDTLNLFSEGFGLGIREK